MDLEPVEKWKECVELERRRLAAGERPKPLFSNGVQRAAARGLCVFLALMAVLTLLSRAADGITVAQVQAQNPKTGILTQRVTVNGNIEPLGDLVLSLPGDVLVNTISAETGQQVKAGDVLMTLDDEALRQSMEKLENELAILELKIANTMQGTSGDSTDGILEAEQALEEAREDYDRLSGSAERSETRAAEDLETARADYEEALAGLKRAEEKALGDAEDAARTAVEAAEESLTAAQDAQKAYSKQYYESVRDLKDLRSRLNDAQRALEQARRKAEEERQSGEAGSREREAERLGYVSQQRETQQLLEQLKAVEAAGGRLTAPVDGTVASILSQPGRTQEGAQAAVLTRNDQGFAFRGKLDQKKAEDLAAGDQGKLTFTLEGKAGSAEAIITSVGAADSQGQVTVTAQLPEGNYGSGGSAELEISKRSQQYDMVLPLSALRMEGGDAYVLVIQEKQSVMGVEQTVVKKTVTLQEQDSENMAVEGALLESGGLLLVQGGEDAEPWPNLLLRFQDGDAGTQAEHFLSQNQIPGGQMLDLSLLHQGLTALALAVLAAERAGVRTERVLAVRACAVWALTFGIALVFAPLGGVKVERPLWLLPAAWLLSDWCLERHRRFLDRRREEERGDEIAMEPSARAGGGGGRPSAGV